MAHLVATRPRSIKGWTALMIGICAACVSVDLAAAADGQNAADRGWQHLRTKPYLPPDFDQTVFENLWRRWSEPLRTEAKNAAPEDRRRMTFSYYGLMESPQGIAAAPLGYVDTGDGNRVMSCLACHAGKVAGKVIPGLPN